MSRTIKVAAVQMDATPAPVSERRSCAEGFIMQAAGAGAQLVVLPELFNIGYAYSDENFALAESLQGETSSWMKAIASRLNIHLAGSILILEQGEIYNSLLLFSPSGQQWRYDKNYPWAWERGYFRGRRGMTIAHTELGDFGLMICWDLGHLNMWKQYAGKVDMVVIASCPPDGLNATYAFSSGEKLDFNDLGAMASVKDIGRQFFGEMVNQQARWLGVPTVNSGASGAVVTHIPKASALLRNLSLFSPRLLKLLPKAQYLQMSCGMIPSCKVVDADGRILAERPPTDGEGFAISDVSLADSNSIPKGRQPNPPMNSVIARMSYFNADILVPFMMRSVYKNGLKKVRK